MNLPYLGIVFFLSNVIFHLGIEQSLFIAGLVWVMKASDYIDILNLSEEIDQLHVKIDKLLENKEK
jgi:hypothetical protein